MKKKLFSGLLAASLLFGGNAVTALPSLGTVAAAFDNIDEYGNIYDSEGFIYRRSTSFGLLTVSGYTGSKTKVTVPAEYGGAKVASISSYCFSNNRDITEITLPENLEYIDRYAFDGCTSLEKINIPESVTYVDENAFSNLPALKEITIPANVLYVSESAFANCTSLESVTLCEGIVQVGKNAFYGCESLKTLNLPDSLYEIGESAFSGCALTSVKIPDNIFYIGDYAFSGNYNLTGIHLPDSLQRIGKSAFPGSCWEQDDSDSKLKYIDNWLVYADYNIESAVIKEGTRGIASGVFSGRTSLKSVKLPDSVETINPYAFSKCTSLTSVSFGKNIRYVCESAFSDVTAAVSYPYSKSTWDSSVFVYEDIYGSNMGNRYKRYLYCNGSTNYGYLANHICNTVLIEEIREKSCFYGGAVLRKCGDCGEISFEMRKNFSGHKSVYGPDYEWSKDYKTCTMSVECLDCKRKYSETVETVAETTIEPTYFNKGEITYIAQFPISGKKTETKQKVLKPLDDVLSLKATVLSDTSVKLTWNAPSFIDGYSIGSERDYVDIYDGNVRRYRINHGNTTGSSFTVTGLLPNTTYDFYVYPYQGSKDGKSVKVTVATKAPETKPAAVTGVRVLQRGMNFIQFSWDAVSGADSYQVDIYRNGSWTKLRKADSAYIGYVASDLSANTTYTFRILAFKGSLVSPATTFSMTTSADSSSTWFPDVTGFKATPYSNSVSLSWNKVSGADSYQIDIYKDGKRTKVTKTTGTSYTATGLSANTTYEFCIYACDGLLYSSGVSVTTTTKAAAAVKPAAVTGFKATPSTNSVSLSWNKVSGADSYQIDIYKNGSWTKLTKTTGTSCTATGLAANTAYKFRIYAFKGSLYSSSVSVSATTKAAASSSKPAAVTGFKAAPSTNSVSLSWNKVSGADSYQVDVYKNGKWTKLTKTTGTSYTATGLSAKTTYKFRIFAFKGSQYSSSVSVSATTKAAASSSKPAAVTGFKAAPSANSVSLSWNKVSGADSYQVDVYKNGKWTKVTKTTGTSCTATGLAANTTYKFRIFAFKGSAYSSSVSISTTTKVASVTGLKAAAKSKSVTLSWNKVSGADSYQVDIYKDGKWTKLTKTTGNSYTATGLKSNTNYKFRVFAFKGSAYSASTTVSATAK